MGVGVYVPLHLVHDGALDEGHIEGLGDLLHGLRDLRVRVTGLDELRARVRRDVRRLEGVRQAALDGRLRGGRRAHHDGVRDERDVAVDVAAEVELRVAGEREAPEAT